VRGGAPGIWCVRGRTLRLPDRAIAEADTGEAREKAAEEKKELEARRAFRDHRLGK